VASHARDKIVIEGISVHQICEAIERGSKFQQTEGYLAVYTFFSVAYKKLGEKYKIKIPVAPKEAGY